MMREAWSLDGTSKMDKVRDRVSMYPYIPVPGYTCLVGSFLASVRHTILYYIRSPYKTHRSTNYKSCYDGTGYGTCFS